MTEEPKLPEDYANAIDGAMVVINQLPTETPDQVAARRAILFKLMDMSIQPTSVGGVPMEDVSDLVIHVDSIRTEAEALLE